MRPSSDPPVLEIDLFGPIQARVSGCDVTQGTSRRGMWVLAVLALREGSPIERQRLAGMVWPDSSDAAALHNLRQTLAGLRRSLGRAADCIHTVAPRSLCLPLSPRVRIDALEFDTACREGTPAALEHALSLYREPILSGCDEPFAVTAREPRERAHLEAAIKLAVHYSAAEQHAQAAPLLRRALLADPYRESTCRALMAALDKAGEPSAALEVYRELRLRLRRDLRTEPDPETRALYGRIRATAVRPVQPAAIVQERRLPVPLNPLIGRESEVGEISRLLNRCRLVTLTGVGGAGKTRLAIAAASSVADRYLDGVWFVDLAPVQDGETVPSSIASALEIPEETDKALLTTVAERIRGRELLCVMDNCEHLAGAVAGSVEVLLSASPGLHVLATSRQSLGVSGEHAWRVPSLSTPKADEAVGAKRVDTLMSSEAVRLFLERSARHRGSTQVAEPALEAIGSICRKLDGIPLAVELAAARTNLLTVTEIDSRLDDRFALLGGGPRTNSRHRTLQAAMEWSWDLLSDSEQMLLMRVSVFRGGFTLSAVESVAEIGNDDRPLLDLMDSLVDRSLLNSIACEEGIRFSVLETVRQFSEEKLRAANGYEAAADAHRDYFLNWAEQTKAAHSSPEERLNFDLLEIEHDNLRAALSWCYGRSHAEPAARLAIVLARFWDTHGHVSEGRVHLETVCSLIASAGVSMDLATVVHCHAGWMATVQRDCAAARHHYHWVLPVVRRQEDRKATAKTLNCLGMAELYAAEYASARSAFQEALEISRSQGFRETASTALSNLAEAALAEDDCNTARALLEESISEGGTYAGNTEQRGQTLCILSLTDFRQGRLTEARANAEEALRLFIGAGLFVDIPGALSQLGFVAAADADWPRAARLLGASEGLAASLGAPLGVLLASPREAAIARARAGMGGAAFDLAFREGRAMTMSEAIATAGL